MRDPHHAQGRSLAKAEPDQGLRSTYLSTRLKPWLTTDETDEGLAFSIHQDGKQGRNRPASAAEATVLYSVTNAEFPHLFALREEMRHWRLLQLDPGTAAAVQSRRRHRTLDADGSTLPRCLTSPRPKPRVPRNRMGY